MISPEQQNSIKGLLKAFKKQGIDWQQATLPNKQKYPPVTIPKIWMTTPNSKKIEEQAEDFELIKFMQECRERTAHMRDDEKCTKCKLRFRCYTEIKVEKKRKTKITKPTKLRLLPKKKILSTVLYNQSIPIDESIDWLKVVKEVAENDR